MYAEIIGRYLSRDDQVRMMQSVPDTPWATPDGLDMPGLMEAFQKFWRENSEADRRAYEYGEATPHLVLMAFLQRVTNGQGRINREMALGSGRLDLCAGAISFCPEDVELAGADGSIRRNADGIMACPIGCLRP